MKPLLFLLAALFLAHPAFLSGSDTVCITGNAPSYRNTTITFYKTSDWITGTEDRVGECLVSDAGDFKLEISLDSTRQLYTYLGIYRGYFYVEPGNTYHLVLPERREKSPEELLNPYFEPVEIHLGLTNFTSEDLNMLIVMFDDAYIPYYDKHVNSIYQKTDWAKLEVDIQQIESPFRSAANQFFGAYRNYYYGMLKLLANQQRVQSLSDEYFNNLPVLYNNPVYGDLFNQVFDKYLIFLGRSDSGKKVYDDINRSASYSSLFHTLSVAGNFSNDTLKELIILKQLHDEFYGSQFSRKGLLTILDSVILRTNIGEHAKIARNIRHKITRLQPGYVPPQFELLDTDGNLVKLSDFRGRYVYLNFCTCQSYSCLNEFRMLTPFYERHKDKIEVITIATDPDEEIFTRFLKKNNYDWKFLYYNKQPEILKEYDIRAFPTYFLIGPDGKLIHSPAVSPAENFEQHLYEVMKARGDL